MRRAQHVIPYSTSADSAKPETLYLRVRSSFKREVERLAKGDGVSVNLFVCRALEAYAEARSEEE